VAQNGEIEAVAIEGDELRVQFRDLIDNAEISCFSVLSPT
jgi:hypothetical protein